MKIITVSGLAHNGKDSTASIAREYFTQQNKKCLTISYADYLKFVAEKYYGWDGLKDAQGRTLLQELGTNKARKRSPDIWVNVVMEFIKAFGEDFDYIFIPDTRFPNEILIPKTKGFSVYSVWVHRKGFDNGLTVEQKNHESETALLDFPFDHVICVESKMEKLVDAVHMMIKEKGL